MRRNPLPDGRGSSFVLKETAMFGLGIQEIIVMLISNDKAPNEARTRALAISAKRAPIDCVENLDIIS